MCHDRILYVVNLFGGNHLNPTSCFVQLRSHCSVLQMSVEPYKLEQMLMQSAFCDSLSQSWKLSHLPEQCIIGSI